MEAIAAGVGAITVGGVDVSRDPTLGSARQLAEHLRFAWARRTRRGFYMRAEDFFNFAQRINHMRQGLADDAEDAQSRYSGYGRLLATSSLRAQKAALEKNYGDLHANSHGEGFLKLFQSRFVPGGLYLLDEPEAPLSPLRQLTFLALLKDMVDQQAQFIIATHSPIILAFPGASILSCDQAPIREVPYEELEHVRLTRDFLQNPQAFLRHL
ncbi:hypothetical protein D3C86_1415900 [compost metagenome]